MRSALFLGLLVTTLGLTTLPLHAQTETDLLNQPKLIQLDDVSAKVRTAIFTTSKQVVIVLRSGAIKVGTATPNETQFFIDVLPFLQKAEIVTVVPSGDCDEWPTIQKPQLLISKSMTGETQLSHLVLSDENCFNPKIVRPKVDEDFGGAIWTKLILRRAALRIASPPPTEE